MTQLPTVTTPPTTSANSAAVWPRAAASEAAATEPIPAPPAKINADEAGSRIGDLRRLALEALGDAQLERAVRGD